MDEGYRKHHMWAFSKLAELPSEYFRRHGFASFQEEPPGLDLVEKWGIEDCFLWAIDRTMGLLVPARQLRGR